MISRIILDLHVGWPGILAKAGDVSQYLQFEIQGQSRRTAGVTAAATRCVTAGLEARPVHL